MNTTTLDLETEILNSVHRMSNEQQVDVLNYVDKLKSSSLSKEKYRREAMKQIREALASFS